MTDAPHDPARTFHRTLVVEASRADAETQTVPVSISSEEPVRRPHGLEVLVHTAEAIDLGRARGGTIPLLAGHDRREVPPPGRIERLHLDGQSRKLRGRLRFADTDRDRELFASVRDGFIRDISVDYRVHAVEDGGRAESGIPIFRATRWELLAASLVNVPADATVGVGRDLEDDMSTENPTNPPTSKREIKSERQRVASILAVGDQYDQVDLAREFIESGGSADDFNRAILDEIGKKTPEPTRAAPEGHTPLGLTIEERSRFSLNKALLAQATGDWSRAGYEREVCRETAKLRKDTQGIAIPMEVLGTTQERVVTVGGTGANLVAEDLLAGQFIDALRNASVVGAAGATFLDGLVGDVAIPKRLTDETTYWVTEASPDITLSDATYGQVSLSPKTLGARTTLSRRLLLQSSPQAEQITRDSLAAILAAEIDRVALDGDRGGSTNEPEGILVASSVTEIDFGTDGGAPTWSGVMKFVGEVAAANALVPNGRYAFISNGKVLHEMSTASKDTGSGQFILEASSTGAAPAGMVGSYPFFVSNGVPSDLDRGTSSGIISAMVFGNWADLLIGRWGSLDVVVNPYETNVWPSGAVQVRALVDVDVQFKNLESFTRTVSLTTTI